MSSSPFNTPLALRIKPSFQKWLIVLIPHFLVLSVLISLDVFSLSLRLLLITLIFLSSAHYIFLYLKQSLKKSIRIIHQDSAKNWLIEAGDHKKEEVKLSGSSFISNSLILINFISDNQRYYALITPDSLSKSEYRRLIVRLKLNRS